MALSDLTKTKATALITAVDAVGTLLPKLHFLKKTLAAPDYKAYLIAVSLGTEATAQTEIITKTYQSSSYIDPFTAYTIFDQIHYPTIEAMSPGWSVNPNTNVYNSDLDVSADARDFYMRGVPLVDVMRSNGELNSNAESTFSIDSLTEGVPPADRKPIWDNLKKVTTEYKNLETQYNSKQTPKDIATQKELLFLLFGSAAMAKTYFVNAYLNDNAGGANLQEPFRMIQVDPYLAYLTMLLAWLGGIGYAGAAALDRFKGTEGKNKNKTLRQAIGEAGGTNWHNISDLNRSKTSIAAVTMLQIFYEYIQSIKTTNESLYTNWMNMIVKDRKCMVNMLVIINERVNLNNSSAFTFQEKPKAYQLALSVAYKTFSMEIGE